MSSEDYGATGQGGSHPLSQSQSSAQDDTVLANDTVESEVPPRKKDFRHRRVGADVENQPLLTPDDPGVSPLNVKNVKIAKFVLNGFTILSTLWLILLLLSDFVSIPGFNNRGRSFLEINFILISFFSTCSTLLFFTVPSELERVLGYVTSAFLALILVVLLVVERGEMGLIGFFTGLWALITVGSTSLYSSPSPVSLSIISDLLAQALAKLKIHGPFVLVGHDIGGLYSQVFASRNIAQIDSILFVDAWHEDLLLRNPSSHAKKDEPLPKEISPMGPYSGFKLWVKGIFSPLGFSLQGSWIIKHRGSKDRIYGRNMRHQGKYLRARLQEQIGASILSYNEAVSAKQALVDIPISVVSSDNMIKRSLNWGNWQRLLTKISSTTYEWKIADGGHEMWKTPKGKEQLQDVLLRLLER
ncbi:uncharacterized protein CYBJADRAFT_162894 [Cyberlindnera jadinii NRRL Y-1542]|uniref:AB hydrolase-1 domain-containing protein n=1 Tax=Cyberlindnera jadinii (strain ATCC 18201 / CBS 1600 / BCRC 20928 / JCM 3617 / NBRC 0987 / NRRL Y-1542) TaxID=983966 RepID=A0A1E4S0I1_CYBJN|nr:hypothetical protein CYBJADRAFT_162894 [Cyberlindnera jadinii NRRL Y-1542]ODV73009.1 hypothetical protein CYBJADRAFT_162894 [Cyberlindnera jadinii NRRL Y-1542]